MSDLLVVDRGPVRTITLDRPDSKNGLTYEIAMQITAAITGGTAANVIVLAGANGAFCSGLDLKDAMQRGLKSGAELRQSMSESFHAVIRALRDSGVPTIAAVDGVAVGFGCDLALACDIRICSDRASFGELFIKRGLMPDGGSTFLLPRIVGLGRALELFYTGDSVDAQEALRIGLANKVYPAAELMDRVAELADRFAAGPPLAYEALKEAVYANLDESSLSRALDREADGQVKLLASKDFIEGVTAFLQKRAPKFQGH
ncbi:MAG TPA: enoyl-CoA hydratase-related protein [Kofleriaceae bacterium]|nr:enoyl-CoA hydratase-related protein [Kofleriaceae bacterium]